MASSHLKRWLTAIVAVPILFGLIIFGGEILFFLLILAVVLLGMEEYTRMSFGEGHPWERWQGFLYAAAVCFAARTGDPRLLMATVAFSVLVAFMLYLPRIREDRFDILPVQKLVFGILYVPFLAAHLILVRQAPDGVLWIFFILVMAFSGDVAAFYVGRTFGRGKLLPLVSPGKTVEGTLGLFAGSVVFCLLYRQFFFPALPVGHTVAMALAGSVIGQLGDLCESALKRASGAKDSGTLLPGHGGFLDRLDCLVFIGPFVYYYRYFLLS
jgi:phosphatidate cytidylyltransferase